MTKNLLSIIIPSRSPQYLQKTVDDLLAKAEGDVEVIIVFDGIWPENYDWSDERIKIIHHGTVHNSFGMRASINMGMVIANGEFVMKIDEHCMSSESYDTILKADCEEHDVVISRRKRLDPEKWENIIDGRHDIDYMHIDPPFQRANDKTCGLHGAIWKQRHIDRKNIEIDLTPTMQGSFYFMRKSHWDSIIVELDSEKYGPFQQEAQEISFKTWFTGGRVLINKRVWHSHWHKGSSGKGYGFSNAQYRQHAIDSEKGRVYCRDYWLNTLAYKEKYGTDFKWFINKFPDMPGWEKGWEVKIKEAQKLETPMIEVQPTKQEEIQTNIIGNGDIATVLKKCKDNDLLFFASGVSDSSETRASEFQREQDLLLSQDKTKHIVYFSSFCVFYSNSLYANHKAEMEEIIKKTFPRYCIVRIGNIAWGNNPHTIINFFKDKIKNDKPFVIQDVCRYVINEEEFICQIDMIPAQDCELSITGQRMKVSEIVDKIKEGKL